MATTIKCNSCGASWPKTPPASTSLNPHVCPDELIETHAVCDEKGNVVTPATYKRVENPRNENFKPVPGKPNEYAMISEGSGVTEIE